MRFWFVASCGVLAVLAAVAACHDNPSIDGSRVPTVANPGCPEVCDRLGRLCGYAPVDCTTSCEEYDEPHRACIGQAPSCREALEVCANESTDGGEEEGGEDGAAEEGDGATEEGDGAAEEGDAGGDEDASDAG